MTDKLFFLSRHNNIDIMNVKTNLRGVEVEAYKMVDGSTGKSNRTVADLVAAAFARHGVTITFGQSLPSAFHLVAPDYGIKQAGYRTENAGGAMADGYARISNNVGIVTAQNGPAATLLVPPLAEALKVSVPLVALVQEVPRADADRNAFQELDHVKLFDGVVKWVKRIDVIDRVDDYVDMAFTVATSGRPGPTVLLIPSDVLELPVRSNSNNRKANLGSYPLDRVRPDDTQLNVAAEMLASAERPLIVAGGGVHLSQASAELANIQEKYSIPVATTVMGKGAVSETHPLSLGVVGYFMADGSRTHDMIDLIRDADVIMFVGARTNQNGTDSWKLFPKDARYIHADMDSIEIGRNYESLRLQGDAKLTLSALDKALSKIDIAKRISSRSIVENTITQALKQWKEQLSKLAESVSSPIRPERIMLELDTILRPDSIVVSDASYSSIWVANYLTSKAAGQRFITPRGLAGLGWGLPLAIGAKFARPDSDVFCIVGDGGFAHVWAELEMLVRHDIPIVLVVLNNQVLGYQKHGETVLFGRYTDAVDFCPVNHAAIAAACGVNSEQINNPKDFLQALMVAAQSKKPWLLDVIVDQSAHPPITIFGDKLKEIF